MMMTMQSDTTNANDSNESRILFRPTTTKTTKAVLVVVGGSIVVAASALTTLGVLGFFSGSHRSNDNDTEKIPVDFTPGVRSGSSLTLSPTTSPVRNMSSSPSFAPSAGSVAPSQTPSISMTPTDSPSLDPTASGQPSLTVSTAPSSYPTPIASANPSMQPSTSPSISLQPTEYPTITPSSIPSTMPTEQPSISPTSSLEPTKLPTVKPTYYPTNLSSAISTTAITRSKLSFNDATGQVTIPGTFHLRIYWEEGYLWQESPLETFWCMACATCNVNFFERHCVIEDVCKENMMVATVECDPEKWVRDTKKDLKPESPATFTLLKNEPTIGLFGAVSSSAPSTGNRIQVHNTNLCLTRADYRDVYLQPCDSSVKEQWLFGFQPDGQEFELYPYAEKFLRGVPFDPERCLTQHHHPREHERIYAELCRRARNAEHSKWVTY